MLKILALAVLVSSFGIFLYDCLIRLRRKIQKYLSCQYQSGPQNELYYSIVIFILRVLTFIQVGKVQVTGLKNLNQVTEPLIVCPNHPHYIDGAIFPILIQKPVRCMVDEDVLRFGFGLGALTLVPAGAFPARDNSRQGSLQALQTGAQFLLSGFPLLIFPEGHTSFHPELRPLKKGAIRIAKIASASSGKSVSIIPVHIKYGKYPDRWLQNVKPPLQYLLVLLGFLYFRRGATVVFGSPISSNDLPKNDKEACDLLAQKILALDPGSALQGTDAGMYETLAFTRL